MPSAESRLADLVSEFRSDILSGWIEALKREGGGAGRIGEAELQTQAREFMDLTAALLREGEGDGGAHRRVRDFLSALSRSRALQGFSPTETATFVFSLKRPVFDVLRTRADSGAFPDLLWAVTRMIDGFGLHTMETYQKTREEVIIRQQREIAELSTPVVKLWDGVLALPLIGTLDSERTQVVMENLLQSIVDHSAEIAIIDITGVPTVDTLVAQHLLKTVAAARLMGADCIVSGIRPQIAQTMVHLGVELNVTSKASLADAFQVALSRIGRSVGRASPSALAR